MLNKDACIKCYNTAGGFDESKWGEWEDELWDGGLVLCVLVQWNVWHCNKKPPVGCPYYLEHLVT